MSKKILITSGPTRAPLDDVRFLTNRSTGRMGTLLANEALRKGARVTMIYGVGSETPRPHRRLKLISIETNEDLEKTLRTELKRFHYDAVIHAMAVLDFRPKKIRKGKTASRKGEWTLTLVPTKKIINQIKRWSPKTFLVGFKLETDRRKLIKNAKRLLRESRADLVVANQLSEGPNEKKQLAKKILDEVFQIIIGNNTGN